MSQATYTISANPSGLAYRTADNSGKEAIVTNHKGSSAPSYAIAGMIWCDDAADPLWIYKFYDGVTWTNFIQFDTTNNKISKLYDGISGLDTGTTTDISADFGVLFDSSAGVNKKIPASNWLGKWAGITSKAFADSPYTVVGDDNGKLLLCNATGGAITVNLPAAATYTGFVIWIKKTDSSANAITIDGNASELIDGITTLLLRYQYDSVCLYCDGTGWHVTPRTIPKFCFSANKNSVDQTGIATTTSTKITFTTEEYDIGGYFDAANSKWTPPAGQITLNAGIYWSAGVNTGSQFYVAIYKNGALFKGSQDWASTTAQNNHVSCDDVANGTDYYEVYGYGGTGSSLTVSGDIGFSFFQGKML